MTIIEILLLAIALAMDAFSVSLTKGFTQKNLTKYQILAYGIFFGGFQFLMPLLGYICGNSVSKFVSQIAPWIAFILLFIIGANMIRESFDDEDEENVDKFSFKELTLLAIATSIDAFAVGLTFAIIDVDLWIPVSIIGIVAFLFGILGIYIGKKIGNYFKNHLEAIGGIILIAIGFKILLGL